MNVSTDFISSLVVHQLHNYWLEIDENSIFCSVPNALKAIENNYFGLPNRRFFDQGQVVFSPYMSVQWMNFLYRLAHDIYIKGVSITTADQIYYLNKIMHSNDWFYAIDLPVHFQCEHPLGSVLGRANYGDYLFVYQGTTVGGNRKQGRLFYPTIGDNVILYANATILGDTHIGNNVVISADSYLINEIIPDNCIVFGRSPDLQIKKKSEDEIKDYTRHIWGWEK